MAKQELTVVFVDPNRPEDVETMLMRILIGKLQVEQKENIRDGRL